MFVVPGHSLYWWSVGIEVTSKVWLWGFNRMLELSANLSQLCWDLNLQQQIPVTGELSRLFFRFLPLALHWVLVIFLTNVLLRGLQCLGVCTAQGLGKHLQRFQKENLRLPFCDSLFLESLRFLASVTSLMPDSASSACQLISAKVHLMCTLQAEGCPQVKSV